ncbi:MAG: hypothetical protein JW940_23400, partial [Polyangiaceae bacterium]|nr:hypothetical protein [Polyangiaceae bacterium]
LGVSRSAPAGALARARIAAPAWSTGPAAAVVEGGSDARDPRIERMLDPEQQLGAPSGTRSADEVGDSPSPIRPRAGRRSASRGRRQRLGGLAGLSSGVSRGPSGESRSPSRIPALALARTVERYKASVSRSCWQPAAEVRDGRAPTTARVSALIRIAPSGNILSAQMSGDPPGYRGLAGCIQQRLRCWKFPLAKDVTTLQVPFVFVAQ